MLELAPYKDCKILLATKHNKEKAIAPAFSEFLSAKIVTCDLDTDLLGTFTSEIPRTQSALECARSKCLWGIEQNKSDYGIASEGSFGPHPYIPFVPSGHEILYFIDRTRNLFLHLSFLTAETNYYMGAINSIDELNKIMKLIQFPSHALIIRPNINQDPSLIIKGIQSREIAENVFMTAVKLSPDGKAWVETDMRAHKNPTRMRTIAHLATLLAKRLTILCTVCATPGFGKVRTEPGLECRCCDSKTDQIRAEIWGCACCDYEEVRPRADGLKKAEPRYCSYCNP